MSKLILISLITSMTIVVVTIIIIIYVFTEKEGNDTLVSLC